jgi:hypothetical protein
MRQVRVYRKNKKRYGLTGVLAMLVFSALLISAFVLRQPLGQVSAQLYPTPSPSPFPTGHGPGAVNCSVNESCGCGGNSNNATVTYHSCAAGDSCPDGFSCVVTGSACSTVTGCTPGSCHPTTCTNVGGLGGCPGGSGSQDDCGGVSCSSCAGGGPSYSYSQGSYSPPPSTPTPTPVPATVRARGVVVSSATSTCADVNSSTNYISDTLYVTPGGASEAQTVSGGTYASWSKSPGTYTLTDAPAAGYVLRLACWSTTSPAAQGSGLTADVGAGGILTWNLGYTDGITWFQTIGGDVYASTGISSGIPVGASPRYFNRTPSQGTAGVVTYGSSYDFDSSATGEGESYISSPGWLANETYRPTDFYAVMYHRFGSPAATHTGDTTFSSKPASGTYFVDGNLTIDTAAWAVGATEDIIVLVDGNLTINQDITLTDPGFVAFIVNGNIIVDPSVGVAHTSSTPALEGVYITSPTGTFHTGPSTSSGSERFVGEGIFIAGDFELERDLDALGVNNTTSSELFIYNPALLISMPDQMRDVPVTWQEVAP